MAKKKEKAKPAEAAPETEPEPKTFGAGSETKERQVKPTKEGKKSKKAKVTGAKETAGEVTVPATGGASLSAALFGGASPSGSSALFSLPASGDWKPAVHQPKPAAKKVAKPSRREKLQAAKPAALPAAVEEGDVNPGWKSRMAEEKLAGKGEEREGQSTAEIRSARKETASARTVFVGNLPLSFTKNAKQLKKLFTPCGTVESVRFRSFAVADLKMPRKAAYIKQNFNSGRDACNAYVVFKSDEPAVIEAALAKNNELVQGRHIRVDRAAQSKADTKHSVFVGNLPFDVDEEELRKHFEGCGIEGISFVRIVRDPKTSLGKGIGFVGLETEAATMAALGVHGTKLTKLGPHGEVSEKRELRVFKASAKHAAQAHSRGHTSDGHSGTVGKPLAQRNAMRAQSAPSGAERRKSEKGQGGAQAQDDSSAPSWQGQTSEAGYVPAEMSGRKRKGGGHQQQQRSSNQKRQKPRTKNNKK